MRLSDDVMRMNSSFANGEIKVVMKRGHVPSTLHLTFLLVQSQSRVLTISSLPLLVEIKQKLRWIGEWMVASSFKNRYTHVKRRRENAFMSGLTDLLLLFHFSPRTNRNRIGQWMYIHRYSCSVGCTEANFLCGIFSYFSPNC